MLRESPASSDAAEQQMRVGAFARSDCTRGLRRRRARWPGFRWVPCANQFPGSFRASGFCCERDEGSTKRQGQQPSTEAGGHLRRGEPIGTHVPGPLSPDLRPDRLKLCSRFFPSSPFFCATERPADFERRRLSFPPCQGPENGQRLCRFTERYEGLDERTSCDWDFAGHKNEAWTGAPRWALRFRLLTRP